MTAKSKPNGSVKAFIEMGILHHKKKKLNTNYVIQEILTASR
jgi:hypothetical protein